MPLTYFLTTWTDELTAWFATIYIVDHIFKRSQFDTILQFVEEHVEELLSILLYHHINRLSFEILKT